MFVSVYSLGCAAVVAVVGCGTVDGLDDASAVALVAPALVPNWQQNNP